MAFVVENGNGLSNANSYASVAEYIAYWADRGVVLLGNNASQEQDLIKGTQYLDANYHMQWQSRRLSEAQALDWPRAFVRTRDGWPVATNTVPSKVKQALFELGKKINGGEDIMADITPGRLVSKSVSVEGVSKSVTYGGGGQSERKQYSLVELLLSDFLVQDGVVRRG